MTTTRRERSNRGGAGRRAAALIAIALALLPVGAAAQSGGDFSPFHHDPTRPDVLRLDGPIDVRTPAMLEAALGRHPEVTTLALHSPGGDLYQALNMVETIQGARLATRIEPGDSCYSACSFLFFAGAERLVAGELGVHQLLAPNQKSAQFVMSDVLDVMAELGVPDEVRRRMLQTPPEEMYVFSPSEVRDLGLDNGPRVAALSADTAPDPARAPDRGTSSQRLLSVKPDGSGDFTGIGAAVAAAAGDTRILVYPGRYTDTVEVTRSVDIVGIGDPASIVWENAARSVVVWNAAGGSISGMTIRQTGGAEPGTNAALAVLQGAPRIRDCDLSSSGGAAVYVLGAASAPVFEENVIHDSRGNGVYFYDGAGGRLEANRLHGNTHAAVAIMTGADPLVGGNRMHDGLAGGVHVFQDGRGTIERNTIEDNAGAGIAIASGGDPLVRSNRITRGADVGIAVYEQGLGTIRGNDISGHAGAGIRVASGGNPQVRENDIAGGNALAIEVSDGGRGVFEKNAIYGNKRTGVEIGPGGDPVLRENYFTEQNPGVIVRAGGRGALEANAFQVCSVGIQVEATGGAAPVLTDNSFDRCATEIRRE